MILYISGHKFHYEFENICRLFFPSESIRVVYETDFSDPIVLFTRLDGNHFFAYIKTESYYKETQLDDFSENTQRSEQALARVLFKLLSDYTGFSPEWGIITGVRPVKFLRLVLDEVSSMDEAREFFINELLVSKQKTELAVETIEREESILKRSTPKSYSLYISIPFCPTRCDYCSFVSQSIEKSHKLIDEYVPLLIKELKVIAGNVKQFPLTLETIYMGGGTPTTLSPVQLELILKTVFDEFDTTNLQEFTVEAGRPDTVTREKLDVIHSFGIERISINPQTFNDSILENIGRKHTSEQTCKAYELARDIGFDNINMDLIAGLPGDSPESFAKTIRQTTELNPESITLHTLALKRSSNLVTDKRAEYRAVDRDLNKMHTIAFESFIQNDYSPYYLYRQSRTVGNLENTGWCKNGFEGLYNVYIIDETHTILAAGAGGISKLKAPDGPKIERIFNFKLPLEYIKNFDEMLDRKNRIGSFYDAYYKKI